MLGCTPQAIARGIKSYGWGLLIIRRIELRQHSGERRRRSWEMPSDVRVMSCDFFRARPVDETHVASPRRQNGQSLIKARPLLMTIPQPRNKWPRQNAHCIILSLPSDLYEIAMDFAGRLSVKAAIHFDSAGLRGSISTDGFLSSAHLAWLKCWTNQFEQYYNLGSRHVIQRPAARGNSCCCHALIKQEVSSDSAFFVDLFSVIEAQDVRRPTSTLVSIYRPHAPMIGQIVNRPSRHSIVAIFST